jgi:hypothetical protein
MSKAIDNAYVRVHWVKIICRTKMAGDVVEVLKWSQLPWHTRLRFDWYFKYRAALLQVKYPQYHVEHHWGNEQPTSVQLAQAQKYALSNARAQVTKIQNAIDKYVANWNSMFPYEDEPDYKKALGKLTEALIKLDSLENPTK